MVVPYGQRKGKNIEQKKIFWVKGGTSSSRGEAKNQKNGGGGGGKRKGTEIKIAKENVTGSKPSRNCTLCRTVERRKRVTKKGQTGHWEKKKKKKKGTLPNRTLGTFNKITDSGTCRPETSE